LKVDAIMPAEPSSPLESFLRDYAEVVGGLWEEVEPQVYDLMLPSRDEPEMARVAFDPEALPEHPGAQLASFGTPLVDRLLADAVARGRAVELYLVGLNAAPRDLASHVTRTLKTAPGIEIRLERTRVMHFPQAVFWFEATFVSDQKEQAILPVAIDLHYGRQVRHIDRLLDHSRLSETPWSPLPEVRHGGLKRGFRSARDRVVRTVSALANARSRELTERVDRQVARMVRYYADLRAEASEQTERARSRGGDLAPLVARGEALDREEQIRTAELRQKAGLHVDLRMNNLLLIHQPKLWLEAVATRKHAPTERLELVWDPLTEALEAVACPSCGHPTFSLDVARDHLVCPACVNRAQPVRR
jgi:hypothetical protein